MCLYPKLIPNKRYLPTKKNGGVPPVCPDERLRYVTAACGGYRDWETKAKTMGSKNVRRKQANTKRLLSDTNNR